ncbi:MAG: hypothetical protein COB14_06575 [Alphaproteobacteria bacterium]|nr:MAG: hypothetical protein COB14_06575 [Alphaproteobacteria bacterium]
MGAYGGIILKTLNVASAILIPMLCLFPLLFMKNNGNIIYSAVLFTYCASAIPLYIYSLKTGRSSSWLYIGLGTFLGATSLTMITFITGIFNNTNITQVWNAIIFIVPLGAFAGALFSSFFWTFVFHKNIIIKILIIINFIFFIFMPLLFLVFD